MECCSCTSATCGTKNQGTSGPSAKGGSGICPRTMGLALYPRLKTSAAKQEIKSQVSGSVQNTQTNHSSLILFRSTCRLSYLTHLSCLPAQARRWSRRREGPRGGRRRENPPIIVDGEEAYQVTRRTAPRVRSRSQGRGSVMSQTSVALSDGHRRAPSPEY